MGRDDTTQGKQPETLRRDRKAGLAMGKTGLTTGKAGLAMGEEEQ